MSEYLSQSICLSLSLSLSLYLFLSLSISLSLSLSLYLSLHFFLSLSISPFLSLSLSLHMSLSQFLPLSFSVSVCISLCPLLPASLPHLILLLSSNQLFIDSIFDTAHTLGNLLSLEEHSTSGLYFASSTASLELTSQPAKNWLSNEKVKKKVIK